MYRFKDILFSNALINVFSSFCFSTFFWKKLIGNRLSELSIRFDRSWKAVRFLGGAFGSKALFESECFNFLGLSPLTGVLRPEFPGV